MLPLGKNKTILGVPWLREVNPDIDWSRMEIKPQDGEGLLLVKLLNEHAKAPPVRGSAETAGVDLCSTKNAMVSARGKAVVSTASPLKCHPAHMPV